MTKSPNDDGHITIRWHIEDVLDVRPDLTRRQAAKVLKTAKRTHDATLGINWDVLDTIAGDLFPEAITHKELTHD